jgi:hypothetical protein
LLKLLSRKDEKMKNEVWELMKGMVNLMQSGIASQLRGVIVAPSLWALLEENSEDFHGKMGVTGQEGTATLRYSFYVLKSDTFPSEAAGNSAFFFVPFTQEEYEANYLGREAERIKEIRRAIDFAMRYSHERTLPDPNPPQVWWSRQPNLYLYEEAVKADPTLKASVGRLLMKPADDMAVGQIVGIALDGYGNTHLVPVPIADLDDFLHKALMDFWPEEVLEFVNAQGKRAEITLESLQSLVENPYWGDWVDYEVIGRIQPAFRTGPNGDGHVLYAHFTATRGELFFLDVAFEPDDEKFKGIMRKYFPEDWQDWPSTRQQEALARFAAALA